MTAGATGSSPSVAASSAQIVICSPLRRTIGSAQVADAELRALQVGDDRDRTADLRRDLADEPRALGVLLVRSVREVQPDGVDPRADERAEAVSRVRCRTERRDDLRPALRERIHAFQRT